MDFSEQLVKFNEKNLPENFVAIATAVENKVPTHAAILIRHNTINYLHHYPGSSAPEVIENFDMDGWYIYKIIDAINTEDESEVGSFLQYCRRICAQSNITYSFIADGSKYDISGKYQSKVGLPELGTCVGFCVNTLTDTLIDTDSYFELGEWDDSTVALAPSLDRFGRNQVFRRHPDIDWELYNAFKKRITPLEYLCSGFINDYPIKKSQIDSLIDSVKGEIENKF